MDHDAPGRDEIRHFGLDPIERTVTADTGRNDFPYAPDLAKATAAEFGDTEWLSVYEYLLVTKRNIIRTMDVAKVSLPASPDVITEDGSLVGFCEIFPFADCFEVELDGEQWAVDDQYCVMPDCNCREVVLSFLNLHPSRGRSGIIHEPIPAARYNYKRNKFTVESKPTPGEPPLSTLFKAMRDAHPSFVQDVRHRHEQLKTLYLRTVIANGPPDSVFAPGKTFRRDDPKIGRNEPCPCGSGRKYKKCCGR